MGCFESLKEHGRYFRLGQAEKSDLAERSLALRRSPVFGSMIVILKEERFWHRIIGVAILSILLSTLLKTCFTANWPFDSLFNNFWFSGTTPSLSFECPAIFDGLSVLHR